MYFVNHLANKDAHPPNHNQVPHTILLTIITTYFRLTGEKKERNTGKSALNTTTPYHQKYPKPQRVPSLRRRNIINGLHWAIITISKMSTIPSVPLHFSLPPWVCPKNIVIERKIEKLKAKLSPSDSLPRFFFPAAAQYFSLLSRILPFLCLKRKITYTSSLFRKKREEKM